MRNVATAGELTPPGACGYFARSVGCAKVDPLARNGQQSACPRRAQAGAFPKEGQFFLVGPLAGAGFRCG